MHKTPGYLDACKLRDKNLSVRAKALASLESYVEGTQYAHLPDWFSDEKPLWERAPCIVDPIVKKAIDSNGDLLLGEGRFPEVRVDGLEGEDAEKFEKAVAKVEQQSRLKAAAREVFAAGQGCGSAAAIFGVRGGRLFIETALARWCEPKLALDGSVESFEIRYPYLTVEKTEHDGERVVCMIYRRSLDATHDTKYLPAKAREDDTEPSWTVDVDTEHGLGFCPVVWFPHLRGCAAVNDFDGRAIHEHLTDEIRAHDFALSQRHRAALYAGDPQWTEIGVESGFNPTNAGRKADVPASRTGRPGDTFTGAYVEHTGSKGKARRKSPGTTWQYPGKAQEVKVQLHCLPGDALKAIDDHAKDLRTKLAQALGVVFLEAESLPNESRLSGKALESFKSPQLGRVDYYRSDFGDRFLTPAIGMLLRIALQTGLKIPGIEVVKKAVEAAGDLWAWVSPPIELLWGEYYKPSAEEEELMMRAGGEAITGGFATPKIIAKKLKGILGIRDVDAYMKELEAHSAEQQKQEQAMAEHAASLKPEPKPAAKGAA